jgi:urea carboxylase-associated protein 2
MTAQAKAVFSSGDCLYEDHLPGGAHWSFRIKAGHILRLTDLQGGANVGMLFYNPANLLERYNAPDTLKCQHTFRITAGHCLYSDMGRIFCSVVSDSVGWHDTVCGNTTKALTAQRWGLQSYQQARNDWTLNGYDSFLVEAAKYGLGRRDLASNLNWFSRVVADNDGNLSYVEDQSKAGDFVDLRFEMDTLVLLHTCPHPLNLAAEFPRKPISYAFYQAAPVADDDPCKTACAENQRGFQNTALFNSLHT